jgi:peptidoglycan/LPS O-acetylase OafA/YrhL
MSIYYLVNNFSQRKQNRTRIFCGYISFLLFACVAFAISHKYCLNLLSLRFITSVAFGSFVLFGALCCSGKTYNSLLSHCMIFLGKHSLGIYLFHMLLIRYFIKLHIHQYCHTLPMWIVGLLLILALSAVVGYVMEKLTYTITNKVILK